MKSESVLISGATGFLGKYLVDTLQKDYKLIAMGKTAAPGLDNIFVDLTDEHINALPQVDYVIHAAGKAHVVPKTLEDEAEFFKINFEGTKQLLNALAQNKPIAFIFMSTIAVYGQDSGLNINENFPLSAKDPYGLSKLKAERILLEWGENHNVRIGILRLPLLIGRNAPGNFGAMATAVKNGLYFNIGKGSARKSMLLAADVAGIVPQLFEKGGIFNLTDGYHPSFKELSEAIASNFGIRKVRSIPSSLAKILGVSGDVLRDRLKLNFPFNSYSYRKMTSSLSFDDSKARKELGWSPTKVLDAVSDCL